MASSEKKLIIGIIIVAVVVAVFYFLNRTVSYEFGGRVTKIENNLISVTGMFILPDSNEVDTERNVLIEINEGTVIKRSLLPLPSNEELKLSGGFFDPREIERENSVVNLKTLTDDLAVPKNIFIGGVTITAKSNRNIYDKKKFNVSEVEYTVARQKKDF